MKKRFLTQPVIDSPAKPEKMGGRVFSPRLGTPQSIPRALEKTPARPSQFHRHIYAGRVYNSTTETNRYTPPKEARRVSHPFGIVLLWSTLVVILSSCIPVIRQSARATAAFPVMNEKIFLYAVVDSSSLQDFEGWPADKSLQDILRRHFRKLDRALIAHFRQREKYGLYEIVEDSLLSSVRIVFSLGKFQFKKDAITFPVSMKALRLTDKTERSFSFTAVGRYRAKSRPKSQVHYLDILLSDFRRNFPFEKMSSVFYRPYENRKIDQ